MIEIIGNVFIYFICLYFFYKDYLQYLFDKAIIKNTFLSYLGLFILTGFSLLLPAISYIIFFCLEKIFKIKFKN
jgi:hypothetical protein